MNDLLTEIQLCTLCAHQFGHKPRPVLAFTEKSKILIIGQAPGAVVHKTGIPWDDKSGENLRSWLGVNKSSFYNPDHFALIPMGFCYPGKGKSGDLPPSPECAPHWHPQILPKLPEVQLTILIGQYSQQYYLQNSQHSNLTETVKHYSQYLPEYFVLPHPSPRNNIWRARNPWFDQTALPDLQFLVSKILN